MKTLHFDACFQKYQYYQISNYLDVKKEGTDILKLIKPPELKFRIVSKNVNKPINNDSSLIKAMA